MGFWSWVCLHGDTVHSFIVDYLIIMMPKYILWGIQALKLERSHCQCWTKTLQVIINWENLVETLKMWEIGCGLPLIVIFPLRVSTRINAFNFFTKSKNFNFNRNKFLHKCCCIPWSLYSNQLAFLNVCRWKYSYQENSST